MAALEPPPASTQPLVIPVESWRARPGRGFRWGCVAALALAAVVACAAGLWGVSALRGLGIAAAPFPTSGYPGPDTPGPSAPVETAEPTVIITEIPDTPTPPPTDPPPPTTEAPEATEMLPADAVYELLLVKYSNNFLVVANNGEEELPLGPLLIGTSRDAIPGPAWGIIDLEPGDCVVAMRARRPRLPDEINCSVVGVIEGSANINLWNRDFEVLFNEETVGVCPDEEDTCLIQIPIRR
jgi:hypothetical protein